MTPRIAVIGTRGIPNVHGGVEYHCEELYPRLVELGFDVTIFAREPYVTSPCEFRGVRVVPLPAVSRKSLEAITHSARAAYEAARGKFDICHFHSVGPAATIPIARLFGARGIVFTMHGPDYEQRKWGANAKRFLRFGEAVGARQADAVISVSEHIQKRLEEHYGREVLYIPNAPREIRPTRPGSLLSSLGLKGRDYVLYVGRLVPDKRVEDLIAAMADVHPSLPVVIAGHSSHAWEYGALLRESAGSKAIFTGWVDWLRTQELFSNAAAFVLPSAVEGLPLSLLEGMAHGVPCIASDIAANTEVLGEPSAGLVYPVGDVPALRATLQRVFDDPALAASLRLAGPKRIAAQYDWDRIARQVADVYHGVLGLAHDHADAERPGVVGVESWRVVDDGQYVFARSSGHGPHGAVDGELGVRDIRSGAAYSEHQGTDVGTRPNRNEGVVVRGVTLGTTGAALPVSDRARGFHK
jgi:glycosyltransferase involved in cell wall biosynthesis